ncbi:MAG: DUF885 family protein, partial [Bacteroidota bacterium]
MRYLCFGFVCLFCSLLNAQTGQAEERLKEAMVAMADWQPRSDDLWYTSTKASVAAELKELRAIRAKIPAPDNLSPEQRLNHNLLVHVLEDNIYQRAFGAYRFPLNAEGGFLTTVVYQVTGFRIRNEDNFNYYRDKLAAIEDFFANQAVVMREGLAEGKTNPSLVVQNCIDQIDRQLETP